MEDGHGLVTTDGSWEARAWTGFSDEIFSSENTAVGSEEERRPAHALRRANLPGTPSGTRSPPPRPGCLLQFALDSGDVRVRLRSGEDGRTQPAEPERPTDANLCALTSTWQAGPGLTETPHLPPQEGLGWPRSEMRAEERRGDVERTSSSPPWTVLRPQCHTWTEPLQGLWTF